MSFPCGAFPSLFQSDLLFALQTCAWRVRALGGRCSWPVAWCLCQQNISNTFGACNHRQVPYQVIWLGTPRYLIVLFYEQNSNSGQGPKHQTHLYSTLAPNCCKHKGSSRLFHMKLPCTRDLLQPGQSSSEATMGLWLTYNAASSFYLILPCPLFCLSAQ